MRNIGILFFFVQLVFSQGMSGQTVELTDTVRISYRDSALAPDYGVEYHYYKTNSQLVFLGFEDLELHDYTWNIGNGRLDDLTWGEYFDYTYSTASEGTFVFTDDEVTGATGTFAIYDASWDLDHNGTPDGAQIEAGLLPNYSHQQLGLAVSGSSSFWLSNEGASSSDLSLEFSAQQIDVIASGNSPWGIVNALRVTNSGEINSLSWDNDWTVDVVMLNAVTVTDGGTYTDEDGDIEAFNQAVMWLNLRTTAASADDDPDFLEIALQDHNGVKRIVVSSDLAVSDYAVAYSPVEEVHIRLSYNSTAAELTSAYSYDGNQYTDLRTSSVAALPSYINGDPLTVALGAESDNVQINAGENTFKSFVVVSASPPASLAGKQIEYEWSGGETSSVPWQELYGSDGNAQFGFSGSVIERSPYTYAQGVVTFTNFDEEIRLSFETATSGTYEYVELDGAELIVDEVGTFSIVAPTLVVQSDDWQRTETMDSELSTNYWNVWRRTVDSVAYNAGELNFLFADGGDSANYDYPEIEIEYGRTLPMDENWQIVLDDILVSPSVQQFDVGLELSIDGADFECELRFEDYGSGREVEVVIKSRDAYADASYNGVDLGISTNLNMRIVHIASSRDLVFECQPDGAIAWTELARLNLANGGFTGSNATGGGFSGELVSTSQRMTLEVQVESGQATQLSELEIGGIEIGSYTPPLAPLASIDGLQIEYQPDGVSLSVPFQELYGNDGYVLWGFSDSVLERVPYTYADGVIALAAFDEEIRLSFESESSGTYQLVELYGGTSYIDETGTFSIVAPSLEEKTDWQRTEAFASELSTDYWNTEHDTEDAVEVANGALNFIFAGGDEEYGDEEHEEYGDEEHEIDIDYGRTLPMDEDWQIVLKDVHATSSLDEFDVEFELDVEAASFECELDFDSYDNTRRIGADVTLQSASGYQHAYASVSASEDPRLQELVSIRVQHDAAVRELVFEYKPDGASGWTELARLNLASGDFSGLNSEGNQFSGELVSTTQRMVLDLEVEAVEATQVGDLTIGGIEIGSYTPPVDPLASIAGLQFEYQPDAVSLSVPFQELYGNDGYVLSGFSDSVLERVPYTYSDGVIALTEFDEEIRLSFESESSGTYLLVDLYGNSSYFDEFGTFSIVTPSLVEKTDWERTETFASELSTDYWNIELSTVDGVVITNGALNFIFADPVDEFGSEIEINYGRTLPMDANWQVVLDDVYATSSLDVSDFGVEFELEVEAAGFECSLEFDTSENNTRQIRMWVQQRGEDSYLSAFAYVDASANLSLQELVSIRVRHNVAVRELLFEYSPNGESEWTELARLDLENGDFSGTNQGGDLFSGELVSTSQRMVVDFEAEVDVATSSGDFKIGGIEIGSYTPPPIDTDGDGLADDVENNTGTNPNNPDTDGDGLNDGDEVNIHGSSPIDSDSDDDSILDGIEVRHAAFGFDPAVESSTVLAEFIAAAAELPGVITDAQNDSLSLGGVSLTPGGGNSLSVDFVIEESEDLSSWTTVDIVSRSLDTSGTKKFVRVRMPE